MRVFRTISVAVFFIPIISAQETDGSALQKAAEKILAIGQKGQLCSTELARARSERDRRTAQQATELAELLKHRDEMAARNAQRDGLTTQFLMALRERSDYYKKPSSTSPSPFDKDIKKLEIQISQSDQCVKDIQNELDTYTKPKKP